MIVSGGLKTDVTSRYGWCSFFTTCLKSNAGGSLPACKSNGTTLFTVKYTPNPEDTNM